MAAAAILSFGVSIGLLVLSLVFKVAGRTRLTLPVIYILAAVGSTLFTDWTTQHEALVFAGLYILIGLVALSWIVSLVKALRCRKQERYEEDDAAWQIRRAREMGIPLDTIQFDASGSLLDPRTGEPIVFGSGVKFY